MLIKRPGLRPSIGTVAAAQNHGSSSGPARLKIKCHFLPGRQVASLGAGQGRQHACACLGKPATTAGIGSTMAVSIRFAMGMCGLWRGLTRVMPWPQIRIHDQHEPGDLQSATSATPGRERDPRTHPGPAGWCRNATGCASLTDVLAIEPCWRAGLPSRQSTMAVDAVQNETSYPDSLRPCRDGSRSPRYSY